MPSRLPLASLIFLLLSPRPFVISRHDNARDDSDGDVDWRHWVLERRGDGAILVRVPSKRSATDGSSVGAAPPPAETLPDAVFSFRDGDPQYRLWSERLQLREQGDAGRSSRSA